MLKQWKIKPLNPQLQILLSNALNIDPIVAQLLINRGIKTAQEAQSFLSADLNHLHDPFLFKNMDTVVRRIQQAREARERVLVFSDYDVDGVTSAALLCGVLTDLGIDFLTHIPHRMDDGYGLNEGIAATAKEKGVSLLIAVDCGISAHKAVDKLNEAGIEVIIIDHHQPEDHLPKAVAIINPKQKGCAYPFKDLASVGLVAKLVHALTGKTAEEWLDLVALGTVADIVPLRGENRIFVKHGLPRLSQTKNIGLMALLETAKIRDKKISPHSIGFILGPRINATGRMDSAHKSLDLLLSRNAEEALTLAQVLETHNQQRQKMQRDVVKEALELVEQEVNFKEARVIVLSKEGWHKGVLGIVAARITEKYYRPSIVISLENGVGTASCRSVEGFHLYRALSDCSDVLENFGGHEGAAGLTIKEENVTTFRNMINEVAQKVLENVTLVPTISIDGEVPLNRLNLSLHEVLDTMEPFGEGNPEPIFCTRNLTVLSAPQVMGKETLKFWVTDGNVSISAVGFGMAKFREMIQVKSVVDLAYTLIIDDWNKTPTVQLRLKDLRVSD
ncbi:MAG: single-stranded-DNA-specific exonuclease RecJ [Candidatus Omnitrophota bacterium]|nr:single-stranded-DNA-specific exonuclease RecJ [Candidatus Omnitrophota bacterium]